MLPAIRRFGSLLSGLLFAACADPAPADLPVGVLALMAGQLSQASGVPTIQGAQLALEADSAHGLVVLDGRTYRVRLVIREHDDRPDAATTAARALITQDNVLAIIGPQLSRHAMPAAIIAENAQIPLISPMSSSPATTAGLNWVFRLAYLDDAQGTALAQFARDDLHVLRAAILYEASSLYSTRIAELFEAEFTRRGGQVVARESFTADSAETPEQWRRLRASAPDVLVLPNFPADAQRQIPALRAAGITATLLGSDSWDVPVMQAWPEFQGSYLAHQWRYGVPLPASERLVRLFRERYGDAPRATAAMTYDAVGGLLHALRRAGTTDPVALRDAIAATVDFRGATGTITFGGRHDPVRSVVISTVRDSTPSIVRLVDP